MEETQQSVWNFDGAELYAVFEIKTKFIEAMLEWNLESAYWAARTLRMELDAKLKRQSTEEKIQKKFKLGIEDDEEDIGTKKRKIVFEKEEVDAMLSKLSKTRGEYNNVSSPSFEQKANYYVELEEFYMHLCYLMKKHGLYFREGDDARLAIFRR